MSEVKGKELWQGRQCQPDSEYRQNLETQQVITQCIMHAQVEAAVQALREGAGSTEGAKEVVTVA